VTVRTRGPRLCDGTVSPAVIGLSRSVYRIIPGIAAAIIGLGRSTD
jgi:hypothetical protein